MYHWVRVLQWLIICAIILMIGAIVYMLLYLRADNRQAMADVPMPALRFTLNADTVSVMLEGRQKPIQTIPFDAEALNDVNRDSFLQTPDINFDGYPDLTLIASQGAQNIYYDGWIWQPDKAQFRYEPAIRALASPTFDEKEKQIRTFDHGSATDHETCIYRYEDEQLVLTEKTVQSYNEQTGLINIRTYRRNDKGLLELVSEQSYTPEQLENP